MNNLSDEKTGETTSTSGSAKRLEEVLDNLNLETSPPPAPYTPVANDGNPEGCATPGRRTGKQNRDPNTTFHHRSRDKPPQHARHSSNPAETSSPRETG